MAHDVFISYAIEDRRTAESVCEALEKSGITCWYAPRDIPFGVDYEEAIVDGISNSRLVVLILSKYSNSSPHVRREIQNASAEENARPILPVRVDGVQLNKALRYYLSSAQWLDASAPPLEKHLQRLVQQLRSRLPPTGTISDASPITTHQSSVTPSVTKDTQPQRPEEDSTERQVDNVATPTTPVISSKRSLWIMFGGLGILLFIGISLIVLFALPGQDADEADTSTAATSATGTPTTTTSATATLTPTTSATATLTPTTTPATATPTPAQTQAELEQACFNLVQGQIAWNYTGSKTWSPENIQNLCRRTTQPSEPPACFHRVMHGGINNGKSTKWVWQDALKLCTGTNNADKTISCFTTKLAENIEAPAAIDACHR